MAALHLVSGRPALDRCLARAAAGDTVVVFGAVPSLEDEVRPVSGGSCDILWLNPEWGPYPLPSSQIDYAGLVALTGSHQPIVSWFPP